MANDLRIQSVRVTTSTNVTGSTAVGLSDTRGMTTDWQAGTHFSRYEIDSKLATGGMAEVWRAKLKGVRGFEKRIVIKTMLPQLAGRPDLVEMFINEATLASAFSHPNIAHVFDFGQLEGRYFIGMEYVPGVKLRFAHKRMVGRGELLPMATTLHVMIDVPDSTRGTVVPAMSVQPLVENAVRHGVERGAGTGRVMISAHIVGGDVELRVSDDGVGIEPERLEALLAGAGGGIGVSNVDARLRATFGERYALRIESTVREGTTAVMTVPNLRGEVPDPELAWSA